MSALPVSENHRIHLGRDTNQALGLGLYAIDFLSHAQPGCAALNQAARFFQDSMVCGVSALSCGANAPTVLRNEALGYRVGKNQNGATCFGSSIRCHAEKAVAANCSAMREWDANGTNFGYDPAHGNTAGEFGHNDFYPVVIAAAQVRGLDGSRLLHAMLLLDEIRGRLAEVFALKNHKIDHVLHGATASAAVYGAMLGATAEQIESAIGLVVAHYVPFRAIRAGRQLSDSKGASAAISAETAVVSVHRAMRGFQGPQDIFRNPEAVFCLFEKPEKAGISPFDLALSMNGDDFAVMGMHFKLGLYEHQSAGAIQALLDLLKAHPGLLSGGLENIARIRVKIYEPAYGIICDPAKKDPRTRQSADHSLPYILATLLRKALRLNTAKWQDLMLLPGDYRRESIMNADTRAIMQKIEIEHGGKEFDTKYPEGIPTALTIEENNGKAHDSGLVLFPIGHCRNQKDEFELLLERKIKALGEPALVDFRDFHNRITNLAEKPAREIADLHGFEIRCGEPLE